MDEKLPSWILTSHLVTKQKFTMDQGFKDEK